MKRIEISEEQRSESQEGFSEVRKLGGQEDRLVNNDIPSPLEGEGCFQLEAESRKLENRVRGLSEEQRSGGQECKLFNDSSLKKTPTCHYEEGKVPPLLKGGGPRSGGGILPDEVIQPINAGNNKKLDSFGLTPSE